MIENNITFEQQLHTLKEIVEKLENKEIPLEEAMELFKRGCFLIKELKKSLKEAKQKVEIYSQEILQDIEEMENKDESG